MSKLGSNSPLSERGGEREAPVSELPDNALDTFCGEVVKQATEAAPTYCSFCGQPDKECAQLIAGPTAHICDNCVELCHEIVVTNRAKAAQGK